uniref:Putative secreted protein n=1 Tax=Anopheles darlingi TaxID=43151 RepID=A0A2M4DK88_ANODA
MFFLFLTRLVGTVTGMGGRKHGFNTFAHMLHKRRATGGVSIKISFPRPLLFPPENKEGVQHVNTNKYGVAGGGAGWFCGFWQNGKIERLE